MPLRDHTQRESPGGLGDKETGLQGEKGFKDALVKPENEKFNPGQLGKDGPGSEAGRSQIPGEEPTGVEC